MKINDIYIEQTNRFCDANCKITAEDILAKAKQRNTENNTLKISETSDKSDKKNVEEPVRTNHKKAGKKTMFRLAQTAAAFVAIFLLSGTTILAVKGDLGTFIRNIFTDNTTAEIIEQGHVYEIDEYEDCGDFALNLLAISGDENTPQVIMDVYVKDETLAAENDRIFLTAYVLDEETYQNEREHYSILGGYGIRDAEVSNLYHVTFEAAPAWLMPGNEAVIAVCDIFTDINPKETGDLSYWSNALPEWGEPDLTIHEIDYIYRITVPENTYAGAPSRKYHSIILSSSERNYVLDSIDFGYYSADFVFYFDYPEGVAPADADEKIAIETQLQSDWIKFASNVVIIVDGTEYKFAQGNLGWVNWNYNGTTNNLKRAYIYPELPAIDYFEAESIILQIGDEIYDLKESE